MRDIVIGNQKLSIKDYYCALDHKYIKREDGKLWLYINITDRCNAQCPFCVNPANSKESTDFDTTHLKNIL